jgi:hypothetical protein
VKNRKATQEFWRWFTENCSRFRSMQAASREKPLDEIMEHLHEIHEGLFFEVSEPQDGICDFVITAEGRKSLFSLVDEIIAAAPSLKGWTFTALRPPMGFGFAIDYGKVHLDPDELWFLPLSAGENEDHLGLQIGIPKLKKRDEEEALNASRILLDTGLGERRSAETIEHVEVVSLPKDADAAGFIQLPALPEFLDWRESKRRSKDA